jgi:hypothetical protein
MEEELNKVMERLKIKKRKRSHRNPGNKMFLKSNKKYN